VNVVLVALGGGLLVLAAVELTWSVLAAGAGAGPVTRFVAGMSWRVALSVSRAPHRTRHRLLATVGVALAVVVLLFWILTAWLGWTLVFHGGSSAVVSSTTGEPAGSLERAYFAGYSVFTLGNGEFQPNGSPWQLLTVTATISGLILTTLAVTYLVPVASAAADRRRLATTISSLGATPEDIVCRAWDGTSFGSLDQHLVRLVDEINRAAQRHLTYPVLHYLHSVDRRTALAPSIVALDGAVRLLADGLDAEVRFPPSVTRPLDDAIGAFVETLESAFIRPAGEPLAPASLAPLERAGIPVDPVAYAGAVDEHTVRRRQLSALLLDDGWPAPAG
jgi:hypothetical protein